MFAHKIVTGGKDHSLFSENAYTLGYIEEVQSFDAFVTEIKHETKFIADNDSFDGNKIRPFTLTRWMVAFYSNLFAKPKANEVYLFTLHEKYDQTKYFNGEQALYLTKEAEPSETHNEDGEWNEQLKAAVEELDEEANLTSYELVDIMETSPVSNSTLILLNTKRPRNITNIRLSFDHSYGLQTVSAIGEQEGSLGPITLVEEGYGDLTIKPTLNDQPSLFPLGLIKMQPLEVSRGVLWYIKDLDPDIAVPYKEFWGNQDDTCPVVPKLINISNFLNNTEVLKVILTMLELTQAFKDGFAQFQIVGTDGRSGIDPNATIGGQKIGLLSGLGERDAVPSVDAVLQKWKDVKFLIAATLLYKKVFWTIESLSSILLSTYATGNGNNEFNQFANTFFLKPVALPAKGIANNSSPNFNVNIHSLYYHGSGFEKIVPAFHKISELPVLGGLTKMKLAPLPVEITAMSIPVRPGDTDITSDDTGRYIIRRPTGTHYLKNNNFVALGPFTVEIENVNVLVHSTVTSEENAFENIGITPSNTKIKWIVEVGSADKLCVIKPKIENGKWAFSFDSRQSNGTYKTKTDDPGDGYVMQVIVYVEPLDTPKKTININGVANITDKVLVVGNGPLPSVDDFNRLMKDREASWGNELPHFNPFSRTAPDVLVGHLSKDDQNKIQLHRSLGDSISTVVIKQEFKGVTKHLGSSICKLVAPVSGDKCVWSETKGDLVNRIDEIWTGHIFSYEDGRFAAQYNRFPRSFTQDPSRGPKWARHIEMTFTIDFTFTITHSPPANDTTKQEKVFKNQKAVFDKRSFINLAKSHLPIDESNFLHIRPQDGQIDRLLSITLMGIFGNQFTLEIDHKTFNESGKEFMNTFKLPKLDFFAKLDETQTKTKINF